MHECIFKREIIDGKPYITYIDAEKKKQKIHISKDLTDKGKQAVADYIKKKVQKHHKKLKTKVTALTPKIVSEVPNIIKAVKKGKPIKGKQRDLSTSKTDSIKTQPSETKHSYVISLPGLEGIAKESLKMHQPIKQTQIFQPTPDIVAEAPKRERKTAAGKEVKIPPAKRQSPFNIVSRDPYFDPRMNFQDSLMRSRIASAFPTDFEQVLEEAKAPEALKNDIKHELKELMPSIAQSAIGVPGIIPAKTLPPQSAQQAAQAIFEASRTTEPISQEIPISVPAPAESKYAEPGHIEERERERARQRSESPLQVRFHQDEEYDPAKHGTYQQYLGLGGKKYKEVAPLNNFELEAMAKGLPNFKGVVMADQLNKLSWSPDKDNYVIFNKSRESDHDGGTHWMSAVLSPIKSKSIEIYDSLAHPIPGYIIDQFKDIIRKMNLPYELKFKYNTKRDQVIHKDGNSTNSCGFFAYSFLQKRAEGEKFSKASGFGSPSEAEQSLLPIEKRFASFNTNT